MAYRTVFKHIRPRPVSDGAGVRIKRLIGTPDLDHVDPFLLVDEFGSEDGADYIKGFPSHPHRGIETVTYMLAGHMQHQDNQGRSGDLGPGDVQWMTAGRGIIHSEMPQQENGLMRGFQIWVNLPAKDKMCAPRYQDIKSDDIPVTEPVPGIKARVIAGQFNGIVGAVTGIVAKPLYLDISWEAKGALEIALPHDHSALCIVCEGSLLVAGDRVPKGDLAVLSVGDGVHLEAEAGTQALLLAAQPWHEPIARHGPFVMNSRAELVQAVQDYQAGRF
ncbi:hypothetical protein JCM17845_05950 [Iodidimonas gelatinilytica]|uniref:Pirin family protein n=1 Tax=Iodidimonas gelatinilytica TaxID=1236966 RepID=A0A5A7MVM2_9PROT|nr:pirin family protein [Iodidimonas gelatinilytica]GEQ99971.1 hypothetical protein JCM17845_05950 [Iodidimonas gelatinilytica]